MAVTARGVLKAIAIGGVACGVAVIAPLGAVAVVGITAATAGTALAIDSAENALKKKAPGK